MKSQQSTFWLFTISIAIVLFVPELLMHGMFFDGITYASVSRNLSEGIGSFWTPHYTAVIYPEFHEHPPLAIGLQSLFFSLFGDHFFIEKVFSLLLFIFTSLGIVKLWSLCSNEKDAWIPVLTFLIIPIVLWSFRNNILENSVVVFTTFATYFYVNFSKSKSTFYLIVGSLFVVAAFLSKGPVGLFPLITPLIYLVVISRTKVQVLIIVYSKVILTVSLLFLMLYLAIPEFKFSLKEYFDHQLFPALTNKREVTTTFRLSLVLDLLIQLAIPIAILLLILISRKTRPLKIKKETWFFILMGLSASLPLLISLKQRSFYLMPSIPFFIITIALLYKPVLNRGVKLLKVNVIKVIKVLSGLIMIISFVLCYINFGNYARDESIIKDVMKTSQSIPPRSIISASKSHCYNWTLVAYMMRYGKISLACESDAEYELIENNGSYELRNRIRE